MPNRTFLRLATAAGCGFLIEAALELAHHQADHFRVAGDYLVEAAFGVALALAAAGLWSLRQGAAAAPPRARLATTIAAFGQAAMALCAAATLVHGADALGPLFMLGLLLTLVGLVLLATTGRRARKVGGALLVGLLASFLVPRGGSAMLGVAWLVVATVLRERVPVESAGSACSVGTRVAR